MGSKYSKSNNEEIKDQSKFLKKTYKNKKNYKCEAEDISLNMQTKENTENSSITTATEVLDISHNSQFKQDLIPFKFEWKGKCSKVLLAGTFLNNWSTYIQMDKNEKTGIFEKIIPLSRAKHEFKFIIGKDWLCSDQYNTIPNAYKSLNNFIDLTNYNLPEIIIKKEENNNEENNKNKITIEEEKKEKIGKKPKKLYNCKFPQKNELNTTAPCIIHHYIPKFDIDYQSRQYLLTNSCSKNSFKYNDNNFNTENNTSKKIMTWPHEKLLHACPNLKDLSEENESYYKICTTIRTKHKYLTLVYYRPKEIP